MAQINPEQRTSAATCSIPGAFARVVARRSAQAAVRGPAGEWTYAELDHHSSFITAEIWQRLGEASEPVALLLHHDTPLIAAILGTLKANKIYVALDPNQPPELLAAMLAASGARLLLTDSDHQALAGSLATNAVEVFPVPEVFPATKSPPSLPEIDDHAGAWLMFTSGSTSAPKGVWQNHCGLVQEAELYAQMTRLTPDDRFSLLTSCGLAASGATLFGALLHGATLCLFHVRSQGVERLAGWLHQERVSVFHAVPTVFRHLARTADAKSAFASVRFVRLGGEPVLRGDVELYQQLCPDHCVFVQSFSSTETGMISICMMDKQTPLNDARVPAGRPVSGVEIVLLDENSQSIKNGGEGKIAIRSARLRQGYWRQPELTAEKFLSDESDPSQRIFLSNDVGRFLPDGSLEHLGRADQLVKIRGQRVDLGELEAALVTTGLARETLVIAQADTTGELRLIAFYLKQTGTTATPQAFRSALLTNLPEHMIPNAFVPLDEWPLTAAGKIDRRALPVPMNPAERVLARGQGLRGALEKRLGRIWKSVLHISPIARDDDFFQLGGTSLQSVEVLLEIEEALDVSLPPSTLAEHGTIEKLAAQLSAHTVFPAASPLVCLREGSGGHPLFLIHTGQGDLAAFGLLTRRLTHRPIYGLQSIGLQGECWPLMSITAMARRYLPEILAKDPTGPYLLGGACMGGLVAWELAQLLAQQNRPVALLALFDAAHPIRRWRMPGLKEKLYCPVRDNVRDALRILRWGIIRTFVPRHGTRWLAGFRRFVADMNFFASRRYRVKFYPGKITLFNSSEFKLAGEDRRLWLCRMAKASDVITIPGKHFGLFTKPAVDELAHELQKAIRTSDR